MIHTSSTTSSPSSLTPNRFTLGLLIHKAMSLSRTAPRALRRTRQIPHFSRRSYSKSQETPTSGPTNTSHTHSTGAHVDPASTSESFGRSFYFAVGLVPVSMFIYSLSRDSKNGEKNPVTRALERYSDWREEWTRRNAIHTGLVEQVSFTFSLRLRDEGVWRVESRASWMMGENV